MYEASQGLWGRCARLATRGAFWMLSDCAVPNRRPSLGLQGRSKLFGGNAFGLAKASVIFVSNLSGTQLPGLAEGATGSEGSAWSGHKTR